MTLKLEENVGIVQKHSRMLSAIKLLDLLES